MKLEIKHLAPYIEHNLKCLDLKGEPDSNIFTMESISIHGVVSDNDGNFDIEFKDIKPLLLPLSYLTKEIEHNGESFVPSEKINSTIDCFLQMQRNGFENNIWSYDLTCKLLSYHFDIFGLIESGLAIDKNTIK